MNMPENKLVKILLDNKQLKSNDEISAFTEALRKMRKTELDPQLLPQLYLVFTDNAWHKAPLDSLISYISGYDMKLRVNTLVEITPSLLSNAKEWLALLYIGILVNPDSRDYLKERIPFLSDVQRKTLVEFLEYLGNEDYSSEEIANMVRINIKFVLSED